MDDSTVVVPLDSPYVVGIDLGTSTSSAAIFSGHEPKIIPIEGHKVMPSVVHVTNDGRFVVGMQAKARMFIDPDNTVASIKREMGNSEYCKEFQGLPGESFSPADISAEILKKIVEAVDSTDVVELKGSIKKAVICVPANFDETKRRMTLEAAEKAGIEVLELLEEPTAAAFAYGLESGKDQTILVYDLGGGTFDVSILEIDTTAKLKGVFKEKAKEGIPRLGGDDFDQRVVKWVADQFMVTSEIDIFDLAKDQGGGIKTKDLRCAQQVLKEAAETAKKELGEATSASITLPNFLKDGNGVVHNIDVTIDRTTFEDLVRDLILESKTAVEKALSAAGMSIEDISRVVLVGGSTKIPLVKETLKGMYGRDPYADQDPDIMVAKGAAIYGNYLSCPVGEEGPGAIDISPVVSHHLGIETYGGAFSRIIEKNAEIPTEAPLSAEKTYACPRDNMTELSISIYQTMDDECEFTRDAICIGEFFLTGIPPAPAGKEKVLVRFDIDRQNLLKVEASLRSDEGAKKTLEVNIKSK